MDKDLDSDSLNIGTKVYYFDLKANVSGVFLKIVEKRGDHRSNIIVPAEKFREFQDKLSQMIERGLAKARAQGSGTGVDRG